MSHVESYVAAVASEGFRGRREDEPLLRGESTYIDGLDMSPSWPVQHMPSLCAQPSLMQVLTSVDIAEARDGRWRGCRVSRAGSGWLAVSASVAVDES